MWLRLCESIFVSSLWRPCSWLYGMGQSWDQKIRSKKKIHLTVPVLSVGNLSVGGTGKTPFVDWLLSWARSKNIRTGLVVGAYGSEVRDLEFVQTSVSLGAHHYGDEAFWLSQRHPEVPTVVAKKKYRGAMELEKRHPDLQLIVLDDGFQHYELHRDLDLVLLDSSQELRHYQLLPEGRLREPLEGLNRAQVVGFTKIQNSNQETLHFLETVVQTQKKFLLEQRLGEAWCLDGNKKRTTPQGSWGVVCGIAEPESFRRLLQSRHPDLNLVEHFRPDHDSFSVEVLTELRQKQKQQNLQGFFCTEKDARKISETLKQLPDPAPGDFWVCPLEIHFLKGQEELQSICSSLAKNP